MSDLTPHAESLLAPLNPLVGLERAKEVVTRIVSDRLVTPSVLLYGTEGAGKSLLADALIKFWLADGRESKAEKIWSSYERNTNPDLLRIQPIGLSSMILLRQIIPGERGANEKPEDRVLSMQEFTRTLPLSSSHKVVVIEDAHRMNAAVANALLKPLEEPKPYVRVLLTTTTISSIKPTILSRCLAIACSLPSDKQLQTLMPSAPEPLFRLASGSPGHLQKYLGQADVYLRLVNLLEDCLRAGPSDVLKLSERFKASADEIASAEKISARAANVQALTLAATYLAKSDRTPPHWIQAIAEAHRQVQQNGAPAIVFDALFAGFFVSEESFPNRERLASSIT